MSNTGRIVPRGGAGLPRVALRLDALLSGNTERTVSDAATESALVITENAVKVVGNLAMDEPPGGGGIARGFLLNGDPGSGGKFIESNGPGHAPQWSDLPLSGHFAIDAPLDATLRNLADYAGTPSPISISTGAVEITNLSATLPSVDGSASLNLTAAQCYGTIIETYGQAGVVTHLLPTAARGMNIIVSIGTAGAGAVNVKAGASAKLYLDGVALDDGDKATLATPAVGDRLTLFAFRTGATRYDWDATSGKTAWTDGGA